MEHQAFLDIAKQILPVDEESVAIKCISMYWEIYGDSSDFQLLVKILCFVTNSFFVKLSVYISSYCIITVNVVVKCCSGNFEKLR